MIRKVLSRLPLFKITRPLLQQAPAIKTHQTRYRIDKRPLFSMQTQIAYAYSQRKDPNNKRDPESENENENEEKNENKQKQSWQE